MMTMINRFGGTPFVHKPRYSWKSRKVTDDFLGNSRRLNIQNRGHTIFHAWEIRPKPWCPAVQSEVTGFFINVPPINRCFRRSHDPFPHRIFARLAPGRHGHAWLTSWTLRGTLARIGNPTHLAGRSGLYYPNINIIYI